MKETIVRRVPCAGKRKQSGAVLIMALISVSVVSLLAATFIQYVSMVSNRQAASVDRKKAFYLAEAGLAEGFSSVFCGRSGVVGSEGSPAILGDGLFWVEIEDLVDGKVQLTSIGMSGRARAQLSIVVQKGVHTLLDMGFFSDDDMTVEPGVQIDSYDSSKGDYDVNNADRARLISNKGIAISGSPESPTFINGDVISGPSSIVEVTGEVTVTGQKLVSPDSVIIPSFQTPRVKFIDAMTIDSPYPYVAPPMVMGIKGLTIAADSEVTLQGPSTLVIDDLLVEPGATLNFDGSGGTIYLYVTNSMDLQSGSNVTTTVKDPTRSLVFLNQETRGVANLRSNSVFHGIVFAPKSVINIADTFEIFGAVGAHSLLFEGPVKLHFDHMLVSLAEKLRRPTLDSWKIDELSIPQSLTSDPFAMLGLDSSTLSSPALAREDQLLDITYLDARGSTQTYTGPESSFDWSTSDVLISATRDRDPVVIPEQDRYYRVNNKISKRRGSGGLAPLKNPNR